MQWCWELKDWPNFVYNKDLFLQQEDEFYRNSGLFVGSFKCVSEENQESIKLQIILNEAMSSSKIEGEVLERESVRSSICNEFGFADKTTIYSAKERGIGKLMAYNFYHYDNALSGEALQQMNGLLWNNEKNPFRTHAMKIISGRIDNPTIHFLAPPAEKLDSEINVFCDWFNASKSNHSLPATIRAGIAHLYFVILHPFDDGNGRVARSLVEKSLSQSLGHPCLIALSETIEKHRNQYYEMLAKTNHSLDINDWLLFFTDLILESQKNSIRKVQLIIEESKLFQKFEPQLNERQKKCLRRLFRAEEEGGFKGGMSASNYIAITKTSPATATRDVSQLVQLGILRRTGENKGARYFLNQEYVPNVTSNEIDR